MGCCQSSSKKEISRIQKPTSRKKEQSQINHLKPDSSGKKEKGLS